jgi:hypothetical protein
MQALAIYDRPVPATAIRYMLPALPVDDLLDSLVRNYAVAYDHELFSLHPLDQRYAYGQLPEGDSDYSKPALHMSAAEFFRTLQKPQEAWQTIEDWEPQLQEVYHLVQGGLNDRARALLNEIDADYLLLWGYFALLVDLRSQLTGRLTDSQLQGVNWGSIGNAYSV